MDYVKFAKMYEAARLKAARDNICIVTASQKIKQPIEEDDGLYDYIFSYDFIEGGSSDNSN
jgi:hypothetical protein